MLDDVREYYEGLLRINVCRLSLARILLIRSREIDLTNRCIKLQQEDGDVC